MDFELMFEYKPSGSQPKAIKELIEGIKKKKNFPDSFGGYRQWKNLHNG